MDGDAARAVRALIASTTVVRVTSALRASVFLQSDAGVYGVLGRSTEIGIGLQSSCLARSYLALHGELTIDATYADPTDSTILSTTGVVTSVVAVINPVLAVQAQRNNLALAIQYCEASSGGIDVFRSPTTLAFGDSTVSAYVGGAAMNHVVVGGMVVVMFLMVWIRQMGAGGSIADAMSAIRCPGPLAFPIVVLVEPTATCAIITILYAEGRLVAIGYASMCLCAAYPIAMLAYLGRGFKAERREVLDPAVASIYDDAGGSRVEQFMFGKGKWIDSTSIVGSTGFCRRNGHFFKEYRLGCHWFMAVEVALGALIGALEGIKLGYGQCQGVLYTVTVLLSVYMTAFFVLRPCISPFANLYVLALTAMQITGCILLCFPRDAQRTSIATDLSAVGSYLVLIKSVIDVCELFIFSLRSCKKYRDHREERRLAVAVMHADVDAKNAVEVPASLLKQPISILARRSRELGAEYPAAKDSGVLELLDGGMYERRGDVLAALEAVCADNVASMKRVAAHKEALDGVWRDWREEAMRIPIELVALAVQLREVEATIRASEASRVAVRASFLSELSSRAVSKLGDNEDTLALDAYLRPMLAEDDDDAYSEDSMIELLDIPQAAPALRPSCYGINAEGYLIVTDNEAQIAKDDEHFPETELL
jgi:hypothetical protein